VADYEPRSFVCDPGFYEPDDPDPCRVCKGTGVFEDGECYWCDGSGDERLYLPGHEPGDDD